MLRDLCLSCLTLALVWSPFYGADAPDRTVSCGAVSLYVVCRLLGHTPSLDGVAASLQTDDGRTSFEQLRDAARRYGLHAEGWTLKAEDLLSLRCPAILHVRAAAPHFIVAYGAIGRYVQVIDPPCSPKLVTVKEIQEVWDGRALLVASDPGLINPASCHDTKILIGYVILGFGLALVAAGLALRLRRGASRERGPDENT